MSGALQLDPNLPDYSLGNALLKWVGPLTPIPIYERALRLNPNRADVCSDLAGASPMSAGCRRRSSIMSGRCGSNPTSRDAHNNLGAVCTLQVGCRTPLKTTGRPCQIKPDFPEAEYNLGLALFDTGRLGRGGCRVPRRGAAATPDSWLPGAAWATRWSDFRRLGRRRPVSRRPSAGRPIRLRPAKTSPGSVRRRGSEADPPRLQDSVRQRDGGRSARLM